MIRQWEKETLLEIIDWPCPKKIDFSIWAVTRDFQQCGILTSVDSNKPVHHPSKLRYLKWCSVSSAGWSKPLLVAHTTLLEISCHGSFTCADPGISVRGGGGPGQSYKKSSDNIFFSLQLILQKSNGQFQRNLSFFKVPEGVQHFPGGGPTFSRGGGRSNCLFPIETHITYDFPGGGGVWHPCPPLNPHLV